MKNFRLKKYKAKAKIVYGRPIKSHRREINITAIMFDNRYDVMSIIYQEGFEVERFDITIEEAQKIGLINFNKLSEILS